MAHPDDAELWAGGTIARHIHGGGTAIIAVPEHDPVRSGEAAAGAQILGANLYVLDDLARVTISALLTEVRPDVVITHPPADIHPEHRRCAEQLLAALPDVVIATGHPARAYHGDGYNNLDQHGKPLHLAVIVNVADHWSAKTAALCAHRSQPIDEVFGPMADALSRLHGLRIGTARAEAFSPLPILGRLPATTEL
jgi:LmbE family N-acetylglucosaminyl deacetylase